MTSSSQQQSRKQYLRDQLRARRRSIAPTVSQLHADTITNALVELNEFHHAQHIALYQAFDGEIPTQSIAQTIWQQHKQCYLPIVTPMKSQLCFVPYTQHTKMLENTFGILEPAYTLDSIINVNQLNVVIVPLVAFDIKGNRLGMGKGYYDKTFSFLQEEGDNSICLIGIGYDFQCQSELPKQDWDIPLSIVITEKNSYRFS